MKKNLPSLLAAALLAIPAISFAENLVSAEDPSDFKLCNVDVSIYEGDPAANTKVGPQKCFEVKLTGENEAGWIRTKQLIEIEPTKRYRLSFSVFSDAEALIGGHGTCTDDGNQEVQPYWAYQTKTEDGKASLKAPTDGWVSMEAIVGPGEKMEWPPSAIKTFIAVTINKAAPGTVVYVKDLIAEETP
jgi:hypothetical protein